MFTDMAAESAQRWGRKQTQHVQLLSLYVEMAQWVTSHFLNTSQVTKGGGMPCRKKEEMSYLWCFTPPELNKLSKSS